MKATATRDDLQRRANTETAKPAEGAAAESELSSLMHRSPAARSTAQYRDLLRDAPSVAALQRRQEVANQRNATAPIQRNMDAAVAWTPATADSMSANFYNHHTPHGQAWGDALAIANHVARANAGPNTSINMARADAQAEISAHLQALDDAASENPGDDVQIETRQEYACIETEWNNGDPRVTSRGNHYIRMLMGWNGTDADDADEGFYRVYHFDGAG